MKILSKVSWLWLIPLSFGFMLGQWIKKFPLIKFDSSIDLAEATNILIALVTLLVEIHISHVLDRKKKKEEYIFEYLVQKVDDIKNAISNLINELQTDQTPIHMINYKLKNVTLGYLDLKYIMEQMNMEIDRDEDKEIMAIINHLKLLCTENSVYKFGTNTIAYTDELGINIEHSKLTYSLSRREEIAKFTRKLINKVFKLIVK